MDAKKKNTKITPKELLFVKNYIVNWNASDAVRKAGYATKHPGEYGHELLKKPKIAEKIKQELDQVTKKLDVTVERWLSEVAKCAFSDIRKACSWGARGLDLIPSDEVDDATAGAICQVVETESTNMFGTNKKKSIKLHDKLKALEIAGRYLGVLDGFGKDTEKNNFSKLDRILEAAERIAERRG